MSASEQEFTPHGVVTTIADKCRRCYNCVRSCPAKAIRVQAGQAQVMEERCIGCGNCIRVCAQQAKQVEPAVPAVEELLRGPEPVVAMLAPSYPAAFPQLSHGQVVAAVRALGFAQVLEVAFGAEMVAQEYRQLLRRHTDAPLISTACPALVSYIEKYLPELIPSLAPIVSPMIALGRAVKERLLPGASVVFIGPCIAKKAERLDACVAGSVDAVLTFIELEEMLAERSVEPADLEPSAPDEPLPHLGVLFPVPGGLLKTAAIEADLMDDDILIVEGPERCLAALQALKDGQFQARFLDALLCEGCIAGPGFHQDLPPVARRQILTAHVRKQQSTARSVRRGLGRTRGVDLSREFEAQPVRRMTPTEKDIRDILTRTNKLSAEQELNCGACGYPTCRDKAIAVYQGLAEEEMCLPYLIEQMEINLQRLSESKGEIERVREVALRARQLASMGQLAGDIAQEVSKPLGNIVVLSQILRDGLATEDPRREDLASVIAEALHCREVMASLEGFGRQRELQWQEVPVASVIESALEELGPKLRARDMRVRVELTPDLPPLLADRAQLARVVSALVANSVEASPRGSEIAVAARRAVEGPAVEIVVEDQGAGIAPELLPRLFQPFVTTKDRGSGAGLGLAVAHGIVQSHGGEIVVESSPGQGTTAVVRLPLHTAPPTRREAIKVLVVDDDPDFLEQHRLLLESQGFEVVTAERSDEALEVASREVPDAFVLDLMMERSDSGARLSRALRRDPRFRQSPILILTSVVSEVGFEFQRNPREVLEWMKADAWFDKPAPAGEMAGKIRRLLAAQEETDGNGEVQEGG